VPQSPREDKEIVHTTITLPKEVYYWIVQLATKNNRSVPGVIAFILCEMYGERQKS
jgi:hypothetical protein